MHLGWPYINFSVMTKEVAGAFSTILTVVFFAFLVEMGPLIRSGMHSKHTYRRSASVYSLIASVAVTLTFMGVQLPLLATLNGEIPSGTAPGTFYVQGAAWFLVTKLAMLLVAAFRPKE